jgi:hypothetical protein
MKQDEEGLHGWGGRIVFEQKGAKGRKEGRGRNG